MTPVTLVTSHSAAKSPQTDAEWREMYEDLKGDLSLGDFQRKYNIGLSRAAWNKYERGLMALSDDMKRELRAAVGLPVPVLEAVAIADPNAAVYRVGTEAPHTVVMVGTLTPVELRINGTVTAMQADGHRMPAVPPGMARRTRTPVVRPVASKAQEARRERLQRPWRDVIEAGLQALETRGI